MLDKRLWIFAVQSYGAQASFDNGGTDEDFDSQPVIVGHQYATDRETAKDEMAEELADNMGYEKPKFWTDDADKYEKLDGGQMKEVDEYDDRLKKIKDELQFFELVVGGEHTTLFLS